MKRIVVLIVFLAVAFGGLRIYERTSKARAREVAVARVTAMLEALRAGGASEQDAIGYWWAGRAVLPEAELRAAVDRFAGWRRERGLGGGIASFAVGEATLLEHPGAARVAVTIDGRRLALRVEPGRPIDWAD